MEFDNLGKRESAHTEKDNKKEKKQWTAPYTTDLVYHNIYFESYYKVKQDFQ